MLDNDSIKNIINRFVENQEITPLLTKSERMIPDLNIVIELLRQLRSILFPGFYKIDVSNYRPLSQNFGARLIQLHGALSEQIVLAYRSENDPGYSRTEALTRAESVSSEFINKLPDIQKLLVLDIEAIYLGDPAAKSRAEILISYPSFEAILIYRLAHELWQAKVPVLPRMMSEYAHRSTGIEIHPGASIDESFFIDHGTGVVIGETTVIGKHVKIYQGVTLGARSLSDGRNLADTKRHPTIEDYVTLYANCSILGGSTVIGKHAVIGGGAFITHSIPPCTSVMVKASELSMRQNGNLCTEDDCDHSVQTDYCEEKCANFDCIQNKAK